MVIYDSEGHPRRRFWPHLLVLVGIAAAALGLSITPEELASTAVEPVNLLLAGLAGWWILKHRYLLPGLIALGIVVGFGITAADFDTLGQTASPRLVVLRLLAAIGTGYLANALRLWLDPPEAKF
jgi:nucleoside recognition membrane protein YjiH